MKTLIICLLIVVVSMFGMSKTSNVADTNARIDWQEQMVDAEEQFELAPETQLEVNYLFEDEMQISKANTYIPNEFRYLEEEENDKLLYTLIFDIFLRK